MGPEVAAGAPDIVAIDFAVGSDLRFRLNAVLGIIGSAAIALTGSPTLGLAWALTTHLKNSEIRFSRIFEQVPCKSVFQIKAQSVRGLNMPLSRYR